MPGLRPVLCRDDRFFAGFLPHGASVDGGREEFEESVPNCRSSSAIRLLCWATVASSSGQMAPCQVRWRLCLELGTKLAPVPS